MTEWFYTRAGVQQGPVSFEQLVEIAAQGALDPRIDLVWNSSMVNWMIANQVPGLFAAAPEPEFVAAIDADSAAATPANPYSPPQSRWLEPAVATSGPGLAEIVPGSDPIDPMVCISRGYDLTKRHFPMLLLVGLVFLACAMAPGFLLALVDGTVKGLAAQGKDVFAAGSVVWTMMSTLLDIALRIFSLFLQLGLVRVGLNVVSGREASIGQVFGEGGKLLRALGATILFTIAMLIGLVLLIVPGFYIALRYGHYLTAIVDRDLGVFESFEYSSSITTNNRGNLFVLSVLSLLISLAGLLLCCVGLIFLAPVVWLASMVAYRWLQYGHQAAQDHPGTQQPMLDGI